MNKIICTSVVCLLAAGCVSSPAIRVSDAQGVESVSAFAMTCSSPFELTRDCSSWSGPEKPISVGGQPVKVASNASGTITVLFGETSPKATQTTNLGYELLKRELVTRGFEITKVTPIESGGMMFGYAIETSQPHYQIWDEFVAK